MNELSVFKLPSNKIAQVYVTREAINYYNLIKDDIYEIVGDIYKAQTGNDLSLAPSTCEDYQRITRTIEQLKDMILQCNNNDPKSANAVISLKDILIKFKHIKSLMTNGDVTLRKDGIALFTKFAPLYSEKEQEEFARMLNKEEMDYIIQIGEQEKTLIEKNVTNSRMFNAVKNRINQCYDNELCK